MAKKEEEVILDVEETYGKVERYIEENKNSLSIIIVAIIVIIGGYFGFKTLYVQPLDEEAREQMWKAEQFFEQDSFRLALMGDIHYGFLDIIDQYGFTKTANLAHYYAGISYLRLGDYDSAIEYLSSFDSNDEILGPIATGAIGDAYMELGDTETALSYYQKAAGQKDNEFTAPIYLMKAGFAHEQMNEYEDAEDSYIKLKKNYPFSQEAKDIDKYIARARAMSDK